MTEHQIKIVRTLAEQNMNISATARELNCHRNSLLYRIKNIQKKTGLDPLNFFDLHELYQIATSKENENGQANDHYQTETGDRGDLRQVRAEPHRV